MDSGLGAGTTVEGDGSGEGESVVPADGADVGRACDILAGMAPGIVKSFRRLWTSPEPWRIRLGMLLQNVLIKARRRSWCCGNTGQPGC